MLREISQSLPMRINRFLLLISLLLATVAPSRADVTFDDLFHIAPAAAERALGIQRLKMVEAALEDFNAVLNFKPPVHAIVDQAAPLPADGGTTYYRGVGYRITISQSLFSMSGQGENRIDGYLYGPELALGHELGLGNSDTISRVSFYPLKTLNDLLLGAKKN